MPTRAGFTIAHKDISFKERLMYFMDRRRFLCTAASGVLASSASSANDNIQIAVIGAGGMGSGDVRTALSIRGVRLVAAADLYTGRLIRAKEVWGAISSLPVITAKFSLAKMSMP
jgi:hypothetical protein